MNDLMLDTFHGCPAQAPSARWRLGGFGAAVGAGVGLGVGFGARVGAAVAGRSVELDAPGCVVPIAARLDWASAISGVGVPPSTVPATARLGSAEVDVGLDPQRRETPATAAIATIATGRARPGPGPRRGRGGIGRLGWDTRHSGRLGAETLADVLDLRVGLGAVAHTATMHNTGPHRNHPMGPGTNDPPRSATHAPAPE